MEALAQTGWAAEVADADWCLQWISEEMWLLLGSPNPNEVGFGRPVARGLEADALRRFIPRESQQQWLERHVPFMLAEGVPVEGLRQQLGPEWDGLVDT